MGSGSPPLLLVSCSSEVLSAAEAGFSGSLSVPAGFSAVVSIVSGAEVVGESPSGPAAGASSAGLLDRPTVGSGSGSGSVCEVTLVGVVVAGLSRVAGGEEEVVAGGGEGPSLGRLGAEGASVGEGALDVGVALLRAPTNAGVDVESITLANDVVVAAGLALEDEELVLEAVEAALLACLAARYLVAMARCVSRPQ